MKAIDQAQMREWRQMDATRFFFEAVEQAVSQITGDMASGSFKADLNGYNEAVGRIAGLNAIKDIVEHLCEVDIEDNPTPGRGSY